MHSAAGGAPLASPAILGGRLVPAWRLARKLLKHHEDLSADDDVSHPVSRAEKITLSSARGLNLSSPNPHSPHLVQGGIVNHRALLQLVEHVEVGDVWAHHRQLDRAVPLQGTVEESADSWGDGQRLGEQLDAPGRRKQRSSGECKQPRSRGP
jgi:hypothetical protein